MTSDLFVYKIQLYRIRREIKHQIKAGIPESELHVLNLTRDEYEHLEWERPDIEFRMGNDMFDIVRSRIIGRTIQLQCVNDEEEAVLFARLDELTRKKMEQESKAPNSPAHKVFKVLKLLYVSTGFNKTLTYFVGNHLRHFTNLKYSYSSPYLEVLTPPPDTV